MEFYGKDVTMSSRTVVRDRLQQLCLVNIDACKITQETFILFQRVRAFAIK